MKDNPNWKKLEQGMKDAYMRDGKLTNPAVSQAFPQSVLQWCSLITRYAGEQGLPADLVAAVIWQESGGDAQAISRSGAVGLMQVMPRDGVAASFMCLNGPCFSNRPSSQQLRDLYQKYRRRRSIAYDIHD